MPNTAKQEAIRKAYGEYWGQLSPQAKKCALEHNGYISPIISGIGNIPREFVTFNDLGFRPRTIVGIEHNNGWIRIESEEDLPKLQGYNFDTKYWTIVDGEMRDDIKYNVVYKQWQKIEGCRITEMNVTHFQPIVKPEKPIY